VAKMTTVQVHKILNGMIDRDISFDDITGVSQFFKDHPEYLNLNKLDKLPNSYLVEFVQDENFLSSFHENNLVQHESFYVEYNEKYRDVWKKGHWIYIFGDDNLAMLKLLCSEYICSITDIKNILESNHTTFFHEIKRKICSRLW
jgi:hypothetical protein